MEKSNRAKNLVIQAQRQLKEITLDFGSQFASHYRSKVDNLCQKVLRSLEKDDEEILTIAEARLQDTLYKLNQEVQQIQRQYEINLPPFFKDLDDGNPLN